MKPKVWRISQRNGDSAQLAKRPKRYVILGFTCIVSTDATLGNRFISMRVNQSGQTVSAVTSPAFGPDVAGAHASASPGVAAVSSPEVITFALPFGGLHVPASSTVDFLLFNAQVGDALSEINLLIDES